MSSISFEYNKRFSLVQLRNSEIYWCLQVEKETNFHLILNLFYFTYKKKYINMFVYVFKCDLCFINYLLFALITNYDLSFHLIKFINLISLRIKLKLQKFGSSTEILGKTLFSLPMPSSFFSQYYLVFTYYSSHLE
jgi:hypothetical protein